MALYDQAAHGSLAFLYGGHDPSVCCHMHSGLALWFLGYPKSALERSRSGLALARISATWAASSMLSRSRYWSISCGVTGRVVRELAESIITLSTERGFAQWLVVWEGYSMRWFQAEQGVVRLLSLQLRGAIADYRATVNELYVPGFLSLLATALLRLGAADEGLGAVADAQAMAVATGTRLWNSDYCRLKGELLLARDPAAGAGCGDCVSSGNRDRPPAERKIDGSCERRSPWAGCGSARQAPGGRPGCLPRFMAGSPRVRHET